MVKLNKIYTRTGDDGTTGLVDGSRIAKSAPLMAAIGDVDEANSWVGVAVAALHPASDATAMLARIQNELFDLGADLATPADIQFGFGPHGRPARAALRRDAPPVARPRRNAVRRGRQRAIDARRLARQMAPRAYDLVF
ncbi:MAG: ATP:cob(I)alamin adenosyltransferase [Sphingopyxis sp.]|nr:ATP:cob(I)alamin adenosyltransferase [Sphingopyxis sp.]